MVNHQRDLHPVTPILLLNAPPHNFFFVSSLPPCHHALKEVILQQHTDTKHGRVHYEDSATLAQPLCTCYIASLFGPFDPILLAVFNVQWLVFKIVGEGLKERQPR
jgi:hypothetical protein